MTTLYLPLPERRPQASLRGLLAAVTLTCIIAAAVLPRAIAAYREWMNPPIIFKINDSAIALPALPDPDGTEGRDDPFRDSIDVDKP